MPVLLWDLYRQRTLHRAYLIWLRLFVPMSRVMYLLWGDPAWIELAPQIVGTSWEVAMASRPPAGVTKR